MTVSVVGAAGDVAKITQYLPVNWVVRPLADLGATTDVDLLVLGGATGPAVAKARRRYPYAVIVGEIDRDAPARVIVDVLSAGADACVRAGSAAILAAHLRALRRSARGRRAAG